VLQIIGWLGCFYLLVKGLEILGNQSNRVTGIDGQPRYSIPAVAAAGMAISAALIFPLVINAQADTISGGITSHPLGATESSIKEPTQAQVDCVTQAGTDENKAMDCFK
jgi:hypothetical protein